MLIAFHVKTKTPTKSYQGTERPPHNVPQPKPQPHLFVAHGPSIHTHWCDIGVTINS